MQLENAMHKGFLIYHEKSKAKKSKGIDGRRDDARIDSPGVIAATKVGRLQAGPWPWKAPSRVIHNR